MIIPVKPKISGQMRFEIPEPFRGKEFWLNVSGDVYYCDKEFRIEGDDVIFISASYSPLIIETVMFTNE